MQILNVTELPIYLPYDQAPLPFGDPLACSCTSSTTGLITAPGYVPTGGDRVAISFTEGGAAPGGLTVGTVYYVVTSSISGAAFSVNTSSATGAVTATTSTGSDLTLHLLSNQVDGVTQPFKSGASAVIHNNATASAVELWGAPDTGTGYGNPQGPGTYVKLGSAAANSLGAVVLNADWIKASGAGSSAGLVLVQN